MIPSCDKNQGLLWVGMSVEEALASWEQGFVRPSDPYFVIPNDGEMEPYITGGDIWGWVSEKTLNELDEIETKHGGDSDEFRYAKRCAEEEGYTEATKTKIPWWNPDDNVESVRGGLNATTDYETAAGYGEAVIGFEALGEVADIGPYVFVRDAKETKIICMDLPEGQ